MKFDVATASNGYTVKVDDSEDFSVARTAEEVAEIVTKALGGVGKPAKAKKGRKARGPNKKTAKAAAANADALAGLQQ